MRNILKRGLMVVSASLLLLAASGTANAVAPANSTLTNTASLSYSGLPTPITASVDLLVTLKVVAPNVVPSTVAETAIEGSTATIPLVITNTSNGPETYDLTGTANATNTAGTTAAPTYTDANGIPITSVTLGATAPNTDVAANATVLTVPSDGAADGQVNGIAAGDTVVIAGVTYTVASIVDNPTGDSTITLTTGVAAAVPTGTLIAEALDINAVIANVGSIANPANPADVTVDTTATSQTDAGVATTSVPTVITLTSVTFEKFVRNVSSDLLGIPNGVAPGVTDPTTTKTYYPTAGAVTATSGDTLEYYLRVTVPAGAGALTGATLTDAMPTFTTYVANSTSLNNAVVPIADVVGASVLVTGMQINDGASVTGTVASGTSAVVTFQVTVD